MQFHLNGFNPGDPAVLAQAERAEQLGEVDVLIVGCGPAGLTLAAQLAVFPDIRTRIVEQKAGPLSLGQADGIACRTMEMFQAFGFCERVLKEAYWVNETSFWKPGVKQPGDIVRSDRIQDTEDGLSEFPHVILNQARVHDFLLETMRNAPTRLVPDYGFSLTGLQVDAAASHPVTAVLEHGGGIQTVRARYLVGCDGAHSSVRAALGHKMRGDGANQVWGVMDVLAVSDFPDIRLKSVIQSADEGSVLIIPREGGYMVRVYVELDRLKADQRVSALNITAERLIAAAQRILRPYTLEVKEIAWWSVYEIGQRLCDRFDDGGAGALPQIFITGDACHTHSPKAGQGMNVSMGDGFNLGWKLAAVLAGRARPDLLHSYSDERQAVAQELIDFDREFARMFGAKPSADDDPAEFQRYFQRFGRFTAGTAVKYGPSVITGGATCQHLAEGFELGTRFHSAHVIRLADARPVELGHCVTADGRWRIFAFCGADRAGVDDLCEFLSGSEASPLRRYTPEGADIDAVIDLRAVFQQGHRELVLADMPGLLVPTKGRHGLRDYEKIFCPDLKGGRDIFEMRGIDRQRGALVIVRPDQYVAHVLPLDGFDELAGFFDGFMLA